MMQSRMTASEKDFLISEFTSKERDAETGLDFFGARYMSSAQGRFTSPDPLLNSGRPWQPQSWNRYAYALNNPLRILDPTGLYNLDSGCLQDKMCSNYARQLKNGITDLTKAVSAMKDGAEKGRLQAALKTFGTQNDGNNVSVKFAPLAGGAAGHTDTLVDPNGNVSGFKVTLDPDRSKTSGNDSYAINAAHESTHINNLTDPRANALSDFSDEYRAYQTSAWAAGALWPYHGGQGIGTLTLNSQTGGYVIWNSSWKAVDDKVLTQFITHEYKYPNGQPYQETSPHDPWEQKK
jgi:RHS repeat-associated protein